MTRMPTFIDIMNKYHSRLQFVAMTLSTDLDLLSCLVSKEYIVHGSNI